jgi:hypothetical protein
VNPTPVTQADDDCSYLAVRSSDGLAVCRASPLASVYQSEIAVINVFDGSVIDSTSLNFVALVATVGPFYDEQKDRFFFFVGDGRNYLSYAVFDPNTLQLTLGNNVTFSANQTLIEFAEYWTFYGKIV